MIKIASVLISLSLLLPATPYPEIGYYECEPRSVVVVVWYDPSVGVGAMTDGLLYVWAGLDYQLETLHYNGWYVDLEGKLVHEWYAVYDKPDAPFFLDYYVKNVNGAIFWANETFSPPCTMVWLPLIAR